MSIASQNIDAFLQGLGFDVQPHEPGQTDRNCSSGSFHCVGRPGGATASDYGDSDYGRAGCWAIFNALAGYALGPNRIVEELAFGDLAIDGGGYVPGGWADHWDHVHVALVPGRYLPVTAAPPPPPPKPKFWRWGEEEATHVHGFQGRETEPPPPPPVEDSEPPPPPPPDEESDPVPLPPTTGASMAAGIFNDPGGFHSFAVGADGVLRELYGNVNALPNSGNWGIADNLRPFSPLDVYRITYDPDNPFHGVYCIVAEDVDGLPVHVTWAGPTDGWKVSRMR